VEHIYAYPSCCLLLYAYFSKDGEILNAIFFFFSFFYLNKERIIGNDHFSDQEDDIL
jgi:hypothetical protein